MTGMKEGAGEDPFAEDSGSATDDSNRRGDDGGQHNEQGDAETASGDEGRAQSGASSQQSMQIPYKFRRDGVQDGRSRVPLFLQAETKRAERDALRELEDRFDDDVSLTDLREALVQVGLQHLGEVESNLESWGYGMTFEE
jgi:hypothetical protein